MPALAALIGKYFGNVTQFFGAAFDSSVAFRLAAIASIISLLAVFYAAINTLLAGISAFMPSFITIAASWFWPDNFDACLSAIITGHLVAATFVWHRDFAILHLVR